MKRKSPNPIPFRLRWRDPVTGRGYVSSHLYDGVLTWQRGYTLKGWKLKCIAFNKAEGLIYEGQVGADTHPYAREKRRPQTGRRS